MGLLYSVSYVKSIDRTERMKQQTTNSRGRWQAHWLAVAVGALVLAGCTMEQYSEQADETAYGTLDVAQQNALGEQHEFNIQYRPMHADVTGQQKDVRSIEIAGRTIPLYRAKAAGLSLQETLAIAYRNSRAYQTRKEGLYRAALAVANSRRGWNFPLFSGDAESQFLWEKPGEAEKTVKTIEAATGISLEQRFVHGGVLILGAGLDLATDFLGSSSFTVGSLLDANFTQPLLRGAWKGFAYEEQYRLERDFVFAVYDFQRYHEAFAVEIVIAYFNVLQRRDRISNEQRNIERLEETRNLTEVLADGGQVSRIQLDQAEQDFLNAQIRLAREQQQYNNALDGFKILLGLPVITRLEPAYPSALEKLREYRPTVEDIPLTEDEAVTLALQTRPAVLTAQADVRDAERNIEIAEDAFLPTLDLDIGISAGSSGNDAEFYKVRFDNHNRYARLSFQYDFDQTDNRDAYRNTLIAYGQAQRDYEQFVDQVRVSVRLDYRELTQSRKTYQLQNRSVEIARRRRILAALQQKEGQASARDVLEAEESLRNAENGLTNSLIAYTTTRLQLLASLGHLKVSREGKMDERVKPFTFERITQRYPHTRVTLDDIVRPDVPVVDAPEQAHAERIE